MGIISSVALKKANEAFNKADEALGAVSGEVYPEVVIMTLPSEKKIKVYYHLKNDKYVCAVFLRDVDESTYMDVWRSFRVYRAKLINGEMVDDESKYFVYSGTEGDFVYSVGGWRGGGHGYEKITSFKSYADGLLFDENIAQTINCKEFKFVQISNIYGPTDLMNAESVHVKDYTVNTKGVSRIDRCTFKKSVKLGVFYGAKSSERDSCASNITTSDDYEEIDMALINDGDEIQTGTALKIWGRNQDTGMSYELECVPRESVEGMKSLLWKTKDTRSYYFENYPRGTTVQIGDSSETEIKSFYHY